MAGGRAPLSPNLVLRLVHLLGVTLGSLGVLLGEGAVLGRPLPVLVNRLTELLGLRRMRVRLLPVTRCFGSKALPQDPPLLRSPLQERDKSREDYDRGHDYGDNENR